MSHANLPNRNAFAALESAAGPTAEFHVSLHHLWRIVGSPRTLSPARWLLLCKELIDGLTFYHNRLQSEFTSGLPIDGEVDDETAAMAMVSPSDLVWPLTPEDSKWRNQSRPSTSEMPGDTMASFELAYLYAMFLEQHGWASVVKYEKYSQENQYPTWAEPEARTATAFESVSSHIKRNHLEGQSKPGISLTAVWRDRKRPKGFTPELWAFEHAAVFPGISAYCQSIHPERWWNFNSSDSQLVRLSHGLLDCFSSDFGPDGWLSGDITTDFDLVATAYVMWLDKAVDENAATVSEPENND